MDRRVLLGAGAVVVVVAGFLALRSATRQQAGQAVDQGLAQIVAALPPGTSLTHGSTDYNPLTSVLTVHDLVLSRADGSVVTADSMTIAGADTQSFHDVFDPARYPDGRPAWTARRLMVADVSLSGMHMAGHGKPDAEDVTFRSVTLHRLSGRPFSLPPTAENRARKSFQADAALAFSLDSLDVQGMSALSAKAEKVAIGSFLVSDYDGGKLGSAALKDFSVEAADKHGRTVHFQLARMGVKNLDATPALEGLRQTGRSDRALLAKSSYGSFGMGGLALNVPNGPLITLQDARAEQAEDTGSGGGQTGRGSLQGLTLALGDTQVPPNAQPLLEAFGMKSLTADIDASSHSQAAGRDKELKEDITLRDLGTLHLHASISGYDASLVQPGAPLAAIMATTLDHATVAWDDASLTSRLMAVAAAQMHTTPELIKAQLAMPIVTLGLMLPDQPDAADQVTKFLNQPHTLTVTLNPPQKVTIAEVAAAPVGMRAHLLGLHIAAE
jgi:hypothetical protein